ncbi:MAG: hypothetical protein A3J59_04930 [Candidatus Buchananbacteria bacterium RIFCSPHIGHO2_02_FULL_56_16]|uniref:Uncharacterized protein n=1 Tax=Candidatus Buchananbacteria bacterium RIFCSPHIGHO2_02_FULL_56_16 TaxID=1797542 RepID=A0A1G1YH90_9BACT|nr:MAG: hypothetical protein A3J59_04930 [Candidatus Buchananbacteria bacterium RIFCSPHIGHO2_02_FULL_56_16]
MTVAAEQPKSAAEADAPPVLVEDGLAKALDIRLWLAGQFEDAVRLCALLPEDYAGRVRVFDRIIDTAKTARAWLFALSWVKLSAIHRAIVVTNLIVARASSAQWDQVLDQLDPGDELYARAIRARANMLIIEQAPVELSFAAWSPT